MFYICLPPRGSLVAAKLPRLKNAKMTDDDDDDGQKDVPNIW